MKPNAKRTCIGVAVATFWVFSAICLPSWLAFLLFATAVTICAMEYSRFVQAKGYAGLTWTLVATSVAWLVATFCLARCQCFTTLQPILFTAVLLGISTRVLFDSRIEKPFETVAFALLGFLYIPVTLSYLLRLAIGMNGGERCLPPEGLYTVLFLVAVVKACDIGGFAVGTLCGRHKMFPRVSPAKSWEGLFGGILLSVFVSIGLTVLAKNVSAGQVIARFTICEAILIGVVFALVGVVGDLIESLFKRSANVKDSGALFKGMGGLLDSFDSLIFAAPLFYWLLLWSQA